MHPLNKKHFGPSPNSLSIRFYNGDALVNGYIYRQIGTSHYVVSDGMQLYSVRLTKDPVIARHLTGATTPSNFAILRGLATIVATKGGTTFYLWKVTSKLAYTTVGTTDRWSINTAPNSEMVINGVATLVLKDISMSSKRYPSNTPFNVYMRGITPGSFVTATCSDGTPLTVAGMFLRGTFAAVGNPVITFTETLAGATGSPKTSSYTVVVSANDTLVSLTIDPTTATQGRAYFGAVQNKTAGSTITATSSDGTELTVYGGIVMGVFNTTGAKTITLVETLGAQTLTSTVTVTV
jgi:hypothetical protein